MRKEAKILRDKSLISLQRAIESFNKIGADDGRTTWTLMALQHSFEMLLKALLLQFDKPNKLFDKDRNRSLGLRKCLGLARMNKQITLTPDEAGVISAIDELRDAEQHWHNFVAEGILYHHMRASVTLFDDLLQRCFGERLADYLPTRVLPVSTEPVRDLQVLIDAEYSQIKKLLAPGRRLTTEGKARIRTLLALHSHADPEYDFGENEVERVTQEVRAGKSREEVLPALAGISSVISGEGLNVSVRISRNEGLAVTYVSNPTEATGIRKVDLQDQFPFSFGDLAQKVGVSTMRLSALKTHTGLDDDPECRHDWQFGKMRHTGYSQRAVSVLKEALETLDMGNIWAAHNPMWKGSKVHLCQQPNCTSKGQKNQN